VPIGALVDIAIGGNFGTEAQGRFAYGLVALAVA
jgi:hypothetical protein